MNTLEPLSIYKERNLSLEEPSGSELILHDTSFEGIWNIKICNFLLLDPFCSDLELY